MIRNYLIGGAIALATPAVIAQSAFAQGTAITGVQFQQTDSGIELILESPTGKQPETFRTTYGETLIIDLINTQLQLPEGEQISQQNPAPGIASVEVVQQYANTVRVKLVGTEEVPTAQVNTIGQGIALNVSTEMTTAQEPAPTPTPEAEPAPTPQQPEAGQQEPIELVVTATRTEERQEDVARSVTVIDREEIEQQALLTENLGDILGKLVPGFGPPNFANRTNGQTLRGRQPQILIDGVPLRNNSTLDFQTRFIAPSSIERIEVVRGPTSIFGGEAIGGAINIITRKPTEQKLEVTTKLGGEVALGNLEADSFGSEQEGTLTFNTGSFDGIFTISRTGPKTPFDAEGDRIPPSFSTLNETETLNFLGKLGLDLNEQERLQLSVNYTQDKRDVKFEAGEAEESEEAIPAVELENELEFEEDTKPRIQNTTANLSYTHEALLGSQLKVQAFYRRSEQRTRPFDFRDSVFNSGNEEETWGGRLQLDTPIGSDADLLWGVDYENQDAANFVFRGLNEELFRNQNIVRPTGEKITNFPPLNFTKLGLFAQLQWDISEWFQLSGGIRNEQFGLEVDDFVTLSGNSIEGGERDFSDTVFNIGAVADLSEQVNVFAKFSQGFSAPDFGTALRGLPQGATVEGSFQDLQPKKVDEYEIGIRGDWNSVQATLSAFYNFSSLGSTLTVTPEIGTSELIRSPKRVYGVEASLDWQPAEHWQVGGILSWNEGGIDQDNDGDFQPLRSGLVQPLKINAYLENQTSPGWRNRLQLLVVGSRDRAFEEDVETVAVESYAVVDYISSIQLGSGTLNIGIQNLFDNQYFTLFRQLSGASRRAAPGRTLSINYSITW